MLIDPHFVAIVMTASYLFWEVQVLWSSLFLRYSWAGVYVTSLKGNLCVHKGKASGETPALAGRSTLSVFPDVAGVSAYNKFNNLNRSLSLHGPSPNKHDPSTEGQNLTRVTEE